jgi:hypothetical protein
MSLLKFTRFVPVDHEVEDDNAGHDNPGAIGWHDNPGAIGWHDNPGAIGWHDNPGAISIGVSFSSPSSSSESLLESIANTLVGALKAGLVTGADTGWLAASASDSFFFICGQYFKLCPLLKQNRHSWANSVGQVTREHGLLVSRTLWDVYSASDLPAS